MESFVSGWQTHTPSGSQPCWQGTGTGDPLHRKQKLWLACGRYSPASGWRGCTLQLAARLGLT